MTAKNTGNASQVNMPTTRRGRRPVPKNETPRERFIRVGSHRMEHVLGHIAILRKLASSRYEKKPQDIARMKAVLSQEVDETFVVLENAVRGKPKFTIVE